MSKYSVNEGDIGAIYRTRNICKCKTVAAFVEFATVFACYCFVNYGIVKTSKNLQVRVFKNQKLWQENPMMAASDSSDSTNPTDSTESTYSTNSSD